MKKQVKKVLILFGVTVLIIGVLMSAPPNDPNSDAGAANNAGSDVPKASHVMMQPPVKLVAPKIKFFYCPLEIGCSTYQVKDCDVPTTKVWQSVVWSGTAPGPGTYVLKSVTGLLRFPNNHWAVATCIYTRPSKDLEIKNEIYLSAKTFSLKAVPPKQGNHWELREYAKGRKGLMCLPSRGHLYNILEPKLCPLRQHANAAKMNYTH